MANAWVPKNVIRANESFTLGASESQLLDGGPLSYPSALNCVVGVKASGVTGTVTLALQSSLGTEAPVTAKSTTISNGMNYLYFSVGNDGITDPLLAYAHISISTAAASGATIERVWLIKEE